MDYSIVWQYYDGLAGDGVEESVLVYICQNTNIAEPLNSCFCI